MTLFLTQLEDLITILDDNDDGVIDYEEFSRWFGSGPPPPPMLPQAKAMEAAKQAYAGDTTGNARIENVGKYQSCMVSKLRIILPPLLRPACRDRGRGPQARDQHRQRPAPGAEAVLDPGRAAAGAARHVRQLQRRRDARRGK